MFWVFANGWKTSKELKNKCLEIIKKDSDYNYEITKSSAWMLLFHNFNKDAGAIKLVESEILQNKYPFSGTFDGKSIVVQLLFILNKIKRLLMQ